MSCRSCFETNPISTRRSPRRRSVRFCDLERVLELVAGDELGAHEHVAEPLVRLAPGGLRPDDVAVREGDVDLVVARLEVEDAALRLLADELEDLGDPEVLEGAVERHRSPPRPPEGVAHRERPDHERRAGDRDRELAREDVRRGLRRRQDAAPEEDAGTPRRGARRGASEPFTAAPRQTWPAPPPTTARTRARAPRRRAWRRTCASLRRAVARVDDALLQEDVHALAAERAAARRRSARQAGRPHFSHGGAAQRRGAASARSQSAATRPPPRPRPGARAGARPRAAPPPSPRNAASRRLGVREREHLPVRHRHVHEVQVRRELVVGAARRGGTRRPGLRLLARRRALRHVRGAAGRASRGCSARRRASRGRAGAGPSRRARRPSPPRGRPAGGGRSPRFTWSSGALGPHAAAWRYQRSASSSSPRRLWWRPSAAWSATGAAARPGEPRASRRAGRVGDAAVLELVDAARRASRSRR